MLLPCVCDMCETMTVFFYSLAWFEIQFMFEVASLQFGDASNHNPYNGFVCYI